MLSSNELVEKIKQYQTNFDEQQVIDAYNLSKSAHSSQIRSSGDPYFSHPLEVAQILIDYKFDAKSIITALLHDVVEDTAISLPEIEEKFGEEIAKLVDGVTKLSKLEALSPTQKSAENFHKLVMAMSQDIRVLLVKLADRLHNMRTIGYFKSEDKRVRIASESLAIYAPLAAKIGMYKIRDELQELSFGQVNPDAKEYVVGKLKELKETERNIVNDIIIDLKDKLSKGNINFEIQGREKKPYSIWSKMKSQNVSFTHLKDIMAFRIITDSIPDCYVALGIINCAYRMIPGSFKDYISTPKDNAYRSLHLSVLGLQNKKIEIQIRTKDMHKVAELGVAAHWSYKEKTKSNDESQKYKWIAELISLFEQTDASEVLRDYKIQMHDDQVFCFTPNGDVFNLPISASVIDFAYAIHSEIGNKCVSAKVNDLVVPLSQKLNNGDQVEIITGKNSKPSPSWMQFATTSKAKVAIKNFIRNEKRAEYITLGRAILQKFFASHNLEINEELLEKVLKNFNKKTVNDLYIFVAEGLVKRNEVLKAVYPEYQDSAVKALVRKEKASKDDWFRNVSNYHALPIEGLVSGMAIHFASCCQPIPGDNIIGVINTGTGVTIHNRTCHTLKSLATISNRLIDVCWRSGIEGDLYQARIMIVMHNTSGSLADVSSILARKKININNIKINNRSSDFFEVIIDISIRDSEHLEDIMSTLRMSKKITEVSRFDG